ncbi:MAG: hypothetical protein R6X29_09545 [Acidimicrobiia bacterium]|jgi:hypothetical protein
MTTDRILIDCDACCMQGTDACDDCVVSVMIADGPPSLVPAELRALDVLAEAGLVPRLRLATGAGRDEAAS